MTDALSRSVTASGTQALKRQQKREKSVAFCNGTELGEGICTKLPIRTGSFVQITNGIASMQQQVSLE
jgi:hypothetical protein